MRNLKKFLALVLAMMMAFSLMLTVNASDFSAGVDENYAPAVEVLNGLGVFEGKEDGKFHGDSNITRAEVAAVLCRILTGHTDADYYEKYRDYDNGFDDVPSERWYAPYVNFASNGRYVLGYNGKYRPSDNVTGYEMLAMLLRALGREQNEEFQGSGWQLRTATIAQELGITENIKEQLSKPATREMVAELVFQTIQKETYSYTQLNSYQELYLTPASGDFHTAKAAGDIPYSLGLKNFGMLNDTTSGKDLYGRPVTIWVEDDGNYTNDSDPAIDLLGYSNTTPADTMIAYVTQKPVKTWENTAVTGADLYNAIGKAGDINAMYEDGATTTAYTDAGLEIAKANTACAIGGRGSWVELYKVSGGYDVVIINTYADTITVAANGTATLTDSNGLSITEKANSGLARSNDPLVAIFTAGSHDGNTTTDYVDTLQLATSRTGKVTLTRRYAGETVGDDTMIGAKSYFTVGGATYYYSVKYGAVSGYDTGLFDNDGAAGGDVAALYKDKVVYMDTFGNAILTKDAPTAATANHVMLVYAAAAIEVNTAEMTFAVRANVILGDGTRLNNVRILTTADAAVNQVLSAPGREDDAEALAKELVANLVEYTVNDDGYYVVNKLCNSNDISDSTNIVRGNANPLSEVDVDNNTLFIVELVNANGTKTYTTYTGIKNVPNITNRSGNVAAAFCADTDDGVVVFIGGVEANDYNTVQPVSDDNRTYVLITDSTPEKVNINGTEYWQYDGYRNGSTSKTKIVTDMNVSASGANLFYIVSYDETNKIYTLGAATDHEFTLDDSVAANPAYGVYYAGDIIYTNAITNGKLTVANGCRVYDTDGETLTAITWDDLNDAGDNAKIAVLYDSYGYVSTVYVIDWGT